VLRVRGSFFVLKTSSSAYSVTLMVHDNGPMPVCHLKLPVISVFAINIHSPPNEQLFSGNSRVCVYLCFYVSYCIVVVSV